MRSASMLAILPLQDWLATDATLRQADAATERINVPADLNHYWRYRMHITLEQMLKSKDFTDKIKELVTLR
jgi:4-alpha-glucanotransferase